jgi:hypothetical protein
MIRKSKLAHNGRAPSDHSHPQRSVPTSLHSPRQTVVDFQGVIRVRVCGVVLLPSPRTTDLVHERFANPLMTSL